MGCDMAFAVFLLIVVLPWVAWAFVEYRLLARERKIYEELLKLCRDLKEQGEVTLLLTFFR